jgi:hypothetical protein
MKCEIAMFPVSKNILSVCDGNDIPIFYVRRSPKHVLEKR